MHPLSLSVHLVTGSRLLPCGVFALNKQVLVWMFAVCQELGLLGCVLSLCSRFQTPVSFSRRDCSISFSPAAMRLLVSVPSLLSQSVLVALLVTVNWASL